MSDWLAAIILGLVEGLTEFIPVSSTGHLLITKEMLGLTDPKWDTLIVLIQLGAILAVVALYFQRLWKVLLGLASPDPWARRFAISVLVAFLPSAVVGLLLHDFIKTVLFDVRIVFVTLIVGGFALMAVERWAPAPREDDAMAFSFKTAGLIGLFQCLAIIPGMSRSGATIVGGLVSGVDKRAAAEFSFFLAIPTMVGAFALDFWESRDMITGDFMGTIAIAFVVSFLSGLFVVRTMLDFVSRHGFAPFAWWRIAVGALGLVAVGAGWL
ncbi:undecaprenyl-diphosphate phosphatase [Brevundimonas aveniformis]|uniref:undecaprenyl-diphosphate phosphatase n=1 Tax=Brevundimonas aveniformis TaxID=370977 RepID=UPI0004288FA3|nr:undecaprenyl-diphosphate phosphatase [Brevundimonas aveniformis]